MTYDMKKAFWGQLDLGTEQTVCLQYNHCHLWLKKANQELWVAHEYFLEEEVDACAPPKELSNWRRWALKNEATHFTLQPRMPDMSVVVRPDADFYLMPGAEVRIYVYVPVWLRVKLVVNEDLNIVKIPSEILSKTWFGSHLEGELCYWVSSNAVRAHPEEDGQPNLCVCPVQIKNTSNEKLLVSKFCLRVKFLSIYLKGTQLWSNETKVFYKGPEEISDIKISSTPPIEASEAEQITPSEECFESKLTIKTFGTLKGWYDKTSTLVSFDKLYNHLNGEK